MLSLPYENIYMFSCLKWNEDFVDIYMRDCVTKSLWVRCSPNQKVSLCCEACGADWKKDCYFSAHWLMVKFSFGKVSHHLRLSLSYHTTPHKNSPLCSCASIYWRREPYFTVAEAPPAIVQSFKDMFPIDGAWNFVWRPNDDISAEEASEDRYIYIYIVCFLPFLNWFQSRVKNIMSLVYIFRKFGVPKEMCDNAQFFFKSESAYIALHSFKNTAGR